MTLYYPIENANETYHPTDMGYTYLLTAADTPAMLFPDQINCSIKPPQKPFLYKHVCIEVVPMNPDKWALSFSLG